jgi:hypothetical protein
VGGVGVGGNVYVGGGVYSNGVLLGAAGAGANTGAANAWTNTNSFNSFIPTSTLTPSAGAQLTTKTYVDALVGSNTTQTIGLNDQFNNALGTSQCFPLIKTCSGGSNLALGNYVIQSITSGSGNTAMGQGILSNATGASFNTGVGTGILGYVTTAVATSNTGVGRDVLNVLTSGAYNTGIGPNVLAQLVSGNNNVAAGYNAGRYVLGSDNSCFGSNSGQAAGDTNTYSASTAIGNAATITASNQVVLGSAAAAVLCPGVFCAAQARDALAAVAFSTTPSFAMSAGMVYSLSTTATSISSLGFTAIPITPQSTYVFTFVLLPGTANSAWYLKPPSNFLSVTAAGGNINTAVPLYGLGAVSLPSSYTYLLQQVTIVNTSTTTTPTFIAFVSVAGY